ncbi:ATP-dependent Clp protease ATP-binding subunit clpt2, chloroplastic [Ancistrocladus abbreviatus]
MAAPSLSRLSSTVPFSQLHRRRPNSCTSSSPSLSFSSHSLENSWLGSLTLSLQSSRTKGKSPKYNAVTATVAFSLPTSKPERVANDKAPKWSWRAIKSFAMGELEARKLKYPTTGTEALLMGILIEGTSLAAKFLRAHGITLAKVREECIKLLGKGDMYFFSPEHPPLTAAAQKALDWAVDEKLKSGTPTFPFTNLSPYSIMSVVFSRIIFIKSSIPWIVV